MTKAKQTNISASQDNPWRAKAKALDVYRWRLFRQRSSPVNSAVRFAREALKDWLYGLRAKWCLATGSAPEPCDFLLLQTSPEVIPLDRKRAMKQMLRERGHVLIETSLDEFGPLLAARKFRPVPFPVPLRYFGYAAHAQWLVEHYQPKILLNDRIGSVYAPFLHLSLKRAGSLMVHLAHATTIEPSRRLSMNDYDYHFLFGRSSLEALQRRTLLFGDSIAVLAGSHMVDQSYQLPPVDPALKVMLVLGVGPDKEKRPRYQMTYDLLRDWAQRHPEYRVLIKAHPRSRVPFWQEVAEQVPNVSVLPLQTTLAEALKQAKVVINIMSNAVIETALAGRAVIYVNCGDAEDLFSQEDFFGPVVTDLAALDQAVQAVEQDYAGSCRHAAEFVEFHLAHGVRGLDETVLALENLLRGQPVTAPCVPLNGTIGRG